MIRPQDEGLEHAYGETMVDVTDGNGFPTYIPVIDWI